MPHLVNLVSQFFPFLLVSFGIKTLVYLYRTKVRARPYCWNGQADLEYFSSVPDPLMSECLIYQLKPGTTIV